MSEAIITQEDLETAKPEDVKFHSTFKALARMMIKYLLLMKIDEERYAKTLTGNSKIIYDEFKIAFSLDKRQHRKDMIFKPFLIFLFVYAQDSDFREFFNYVFFRLLRRGGEFFFPPHHLNPGCWTDNDGNRTIKGCGVSRDILIDLNGSSIVVNTLLPFDSYWLTIEPEKDKYYSTDTNRPEWVGVGWKYRLYCYYGTEATFRQNLIMGDPK